MLILRFFSIYLPLISSSFRLESPEFDEDNTNWILASRSVIMMKKLPEGVNYTIREYYQNWNMVYEEEMAKKDIAYASAPFIDADLLHYKSFRPEITILFNIQIQKCVGKKENKLFTRSKKERYLDKKAVIRWDVDYCGTETVLNWCDMGRRLVTRMTAESTIKESQVFFKTNITATCPSTLWASFSLIFHVTHVGEEENHFTWAFYVALGFFVVIAFSCAGFGFVQIYRKYREWKEKRRNRYIYRPKKSSKSLNSAIVQMEPNNFPKQK